MSQKEREELRQLWAGLVAEFRISGLGQAQWCREHGYKVWRLQYCVRKCEWVPPSSRCEPCSTRTSCGRWSAAWHDRGTLRSGDARVPGKSDPMNISIGLSTGITRNGR